MRKFYVMINGQQQGPYTVEQIKSMGCDNSTYVFNNEVSKEWKKISDVADFSSSGNPAPPPPFQPDSSPLPLHYPTTPNSSTINQKPPKTWLLESILVTLFCCLPFGIAGIVNASKVESRFYAGDIAGANRASQEAKKWTTTSFWIGLVVGVIYLIVAIAAGAGGY